MREAKQRLWGTLGMLLLTLLAVVGCGERDSGAGKALQVPVRVAESQPMVGSRTFTGRAEGARVVEVRARVDGTLQNRAYIEGTQVEAGQVLFRTDPRRYEVRVQRAEAELERAKAEVRQAEREWERMAELYADNALSKRELDEAESVLELARAGVALAEAELADTLIDLDHATVHAPVSGMASRSEQPEGSLVRAGDLLTRVIQFDPIHVQFAIPEAQATAFRDQLRIGAPVSLILSRGKVFPEQGVIDYTDGTVDSATGTVGARALFRNPRRDLMPGQFVRLTVHGLDLGSGIPVPQRAVAQGRGHPQVFVVDDDNVVRARRVVLGPEVGNEVLIVEGVADGERIVIGGVASLTDGDRVDPLEEPRPANQGQNEIDVSAPMQGVALPPEVPEIEEEAPQPSEGPHEMPAESEAVPALAPDAAEDEER